jgi:hypothetical protein
MLDCYGEGGNRPRYMKPGVVYWRCGDATATGSTPTLRDANSAKETLGSDRWPPVAVEARAGTPWSL